MFEEQYQSKTIEELEAMVVARGKEKTDAHIEQIRILEHIRTAHRWRENPRYARESFWTYLSDRFNIRPSTYDKSRLAVLKWPDATREYGVGVIAKIKDHCGAKQTEKVIRELDIAKAKTKNGLKRDKIESIINAHKIEKSDIQSPQPRKTAAYWKAQHDQVLADLEKAKATISALMDENRELTAQIEKLKFTAQRYDQIRNVINSKLVQASA